MHTFFESIAVRSENFDAIRKVVKQLAENNLFRDF